MDLLERPFVRNCVNFRTVPQLLASLEHCEGVKTAHETKLSWLRQIRQEATAIGAKDVLMRAWRVSAIAASEAGDVLEASMCAHKVGELSGLFGEIAFACDALLGDSYQFIVDHMASSSSGTPWYVRSAAALLCGNYFQVLRILDDADHAHAILAEPVAILMRQRATEQLEALRKKVFR
jgi:hypothetical protein